MACYVFAKQDKANLYVSVLLRTCRLVVDGHCLQSLVGTLDHCIPGAGMNCPDRNCTGCNWVALGVGGGCMVHYELKQNRKYIISVFPVGVCPILE